MPGLPLPRTDRTSSHARRALAVLGLALVLPASASAASPPVISAPEGGAQFDAAAMPMQVIWDEGDPGTTSGFDVYPALGACSTSGGSAAHVASDGTSITYGANITLGPP